MGHHHHHHPAHSHEGGSPATTPSGIDKLIKIIEHWIQHNEDHARSYREWAERAEQLGQEQVAQILQGVAKESLQQNQQMAEALAILQARHSPH